VKFALAFFLGVAACAMSAVAVFLVVGWMDDEPPAPTRRHYLGGTSYSCERISPDSGDTYFLTQHACRLEFCRGGWRETEDLLPVAICGEPTGPRIDN